MWLKIVDGGIVLPQLVRYVILSDLYVDLSDIVDSSLFIC